jgi:hypothetical protein
LGGGAAARAAAHAPACAPGRAVPQPAQVSAPPQDHEALLDPEPVSYEPPARDDDEPEPWYYHFIERFVTSAMWVGVMLCVASFILWSVVFLTMGYQGTSAAGVGGGFAAFFLWLFFGVFHFVWAMCVISGCAWLLLALDAARNLRRIRIKLPYRP